MAANFAVLVLLLSGLWPASITACTYVDLTITKAAKAAKALETSAFDINQVRDHFKQKEYVTYAKNTDTTFRCGIPAVTGRSSTAETYDSSQPRLKQSYSMALQ